MKTVYIVTGGCGYIGYNVVKQLREQGKNVRVVVTSDKHASSVKNLGAKVFVGDVRKIETVEPAFQGENIELKIIHIAGIVSVETKFNQFVYDVNVNGTNNMLELAKKYNAKKFVYLGSVDAIPPVKDKVFSDYKEFDPDEVVTIYAKTKAIAINSVIKSAKDGLDACVVLPTAVFGPYDYKNGVVSKMLISYGNKKKMPLIQGGYDFVDVRDLGAGIISATEKGRAGEVYILCGEYVDVITFINEVRTVRGFDPVKVVLPNAVSKTAGFFAETVSNVTKKPPVFTPYTITCINSGVRYSSKKAEKELGYKCRQRSESVKDMVEFMEKQGRFN